LSQVARAVHSGVAPIWGRHRSPGCGSSAGQRVVPVLLLHSSGARGASCACTGVRPTGSPLGGPCRSVVPHSEIQICAGLSAGVRSIRKRGSPGTVEFAILTTAGGCKTSWRNEKGRHPASLMRPNGMLCGEGVMNGSDDCVKFCTVHGCFMVWPGRLRVACLRRSHLRSGIREADGARHGEADARSSEGEMPRWARGDGARAEYVYMALRD